MSREDGRNPMYGVKKRVKVPEKDLVYIRIIIFFM